MASDAHGIHLACGHRMFETHDMIEGTSEELSLY